MAGKPDEKETGDDPPIFLNFLKHKIQEDLQSQKNKF